ncbi:hypothetical protein [Acinetobacter lwoffii]|uniref:hypothetical protein n=1 Tax=Acinetobacter lwoffii TaxID=28090 RepID=UPI0014439E5B|nr:hypothetical protein [Acinetobacter lwoffii]MCU4616394.1 hypothetical protein [Acinetobacter lwoffii]NKS45349.1 hypothetical protein [Acinetobacter lwoffii]
MSFKYQAPENFKATSLEIAGTTYKVEKGVIESDIDIAHILAPHGFKRAVSETKAEPKKETAAAK